MPSLETQPRAFRRTAEAVASARKSRGGLLLLLPALGYLCLFFFLPIAFLLLQSALTPDNYLRVFRESVYLDVMYRTAKMSLAVTGVCLVLGYPFAYFMSTASQRVVNVAVGVVMLPFWTSILVRSYAWLVLLQREGVVNKVPLEPGNHRPSAQTCVQLKWSDMRHQLHHASVYDFGFVCEHAKY